ncbi:DinB family protein [Paenibacillus sp. LS1]|uniref:DinB family protein n=1 Tax=Paenibacillus sp. LS1 TaxID=2992120 RepID=UPI00223184C4|nr:DinB family protein [Paenibacillus sp. LS1]MCW3792937.1 DinB family protein [Paenibacillus sp. LS1]
MGNTTEKTGSIISAYVDAYDEIEQEIAGLTEQQLKWKSSPSTWSVTEVLAHLVDHSIVVSFRIREILAGSTVTLPAFAQDAWVAGQKANEEQISRLVTIAHSLVQYNAGLLERLDDEEWSKTGINFKGETVSLSAIIPAFVAHVENHLNQIRRIKQAAAEKQVQ